MLQNGPISGLQIGADFRIYKLDQEVLQVGSYRYFKSRQNDYKLGQKFSNWDRYYKLVKNDFKSEQGFQIGAEQPHHNFPPITIY